MSKCAENIWERIHKRLPENVYGIGFKAIRKKIDGVHWTSPPQEAKG